MKIAKKLIVVFLCLLNMQNYAMECSGMFQTNNITAAMCNSAQAIFSVGLNHKCLTTIGLTAAALLVIPTVRRALVSNSCSVVATTCSNLGWFCNSQRLLKWGYKLRGDYNKRDSQNKTPLHRAVERQDTIDVQALLEAGAGVNARDDDGCTPLHYASQGILRKPAIVQALIQAGADVTIMNPKNEIPLKLATKSPGSQEVIKLLLKEHVRIGNSGFCQTLLHLAAHVGDSEVIQDLINQGCDVNALNSLGLSPLYLAIRERRTDAALTLIKNKACIDASWGSRTALYLAAELGLAEVVRALIGAGADISTTDSYQHSLVHAAVMSNNLKTLKALIEAGVPLDNQDAGGLTPLHVAVTHSRPKCIPMLVQTGANYSTITDSEGLTARQRAARFTQDAEMNNYFDKIPGLLTELLEAIRAGDLSRVKELIELGAPVCTPDSGGKLPLHYAIKEYVPAKPSAMDYIARELLSAGSPLAVNARNSKGLTPLHIAASYGNTRIARLLLEKGADVNAQDVGGNTPLHCTATKKMRTLLIMSKADVSIVNNDRQTAISPNIGLWTKCFA